MPPCIMCILEAFFYPTLIMMDLGAHSPHAFCSVYLFQFPPNPLVADFPLLWGAGASGPGGGGGAKARNCDTRGVV